MPGFAHELAEVCGTRVSRARAMPRASSAPLVLVPRCKLRFARSGNFVVAILHCDAAPGVVLAFAARVDLRAVHARISGAVGAAAYPPYDPSLDPHPGKYDIIQAYIEGHGKRAERGLLRDFATYAGRLGYSRQNPPPHAMFIDWGEHHGLHKSKSMLGKLGDALKQSAAIIAPIAATAAPGAGTAAIVTAQSALNAAKLAGAAHAMQLASRAVSALPGGAQNLAPALDAARGMLVAMHAAKLGDPRAKQALFYAARKALAGDAAAQPGARMAAKTYRLAVLPG